MKLEVGKQYESVSDPKVLVIAESEGEKPSAQPFAAKPNYTGNTQVAKFVNCKQVAGPAIPGSKDGKFSIPDERFVLEYKLSDPQPTAKPTFQPNPINPVVPEPVKPSPTAKPAPVPEPKK